MSRGIGGMGVVEKADLNQFDVRHIKDNPASPLPGL
jgi:hypothetical protein